MNIKLPKEYLSYSQMRLWIEDKEKYRARYYRNEKDFATKALLFGSEISKKLEDGSFVLPEGLQYETPEYEIKIDIDGVPFFAYLDTFSDPRLKFREYKTGQLTSDGKDRWTQESVNRHWQLDIYSLLVQLKHGSVDDECHLDWLEVRRKIKTIVFEGNELKSESTDLELTGRIESFRRVITQKDRDMTRILIVSVAMEISADYAEYLSKNP